MWLRIWSWIPDSPVIDTIPSPARGDCCSSVSPIVLGVLNVCCMHTRLVCWNVHFLPWRNEITTLVFPMRLHNYKFKWPLTVLYVNPTRSPMTVVMTCFPAHSGRFSIVFNNNLFQDSFRWGAPTCRGRWTPGHECGGCGKGQPRVFYV